MKTAFSAGISVTRGWWAAQVSALGNYGAPSNKEQNGMLLLRMNSKPGVSAHGHVRVTSGETHQLGLRLHEDALEGCTGL